MNIKEIQQKNELVYLKSLRLKQLFDNTDLSAIRNPEDINNPELFFTLISTLTAQSKAPAAEKFIAKKLNVKKVSASLGRGDFKTEDEKYIELKMSFTNAAKCLNLRQIRLWQNVDQYLCIYINEEKFTDSLIFLLTKKEMEEEILIMGGFTHGTKDANELNENNEYSITLKIDSENENRKRWNKYLNNDLYKILINNSKSESTI